VAALVRVASIGVRRPPEAESSGMVEPDGEQVRAPVPYPGRPAAGLLAHRTRPSGLGLVITLG